MELYKKNEIENLSFEQILEREGAGEEETNETVGQTLYDPDVQTTRLNNILLGNDTGRLITTGENNTFIGFQAGFSNTTGSNNFFAGVYTGKNNTAGYNNCFIGNSAGLYSVLGYNNIAIGNAAMQGRAGGTEVGHGNTVMGFFSGIMMDGGYNNVAIGNNTLGGQNSSPDYMYGSYNVCIGETAGGNLTGGNSNTFIGYLSGATATTSNGNVFLGTMAGYYETGSNKLFIDALTRNTEADARAKALIYGIFASTTANQHLYLNSNVYISDTLTIGGTAISSLYQPLDADLTAIAGLSSADSNFIVGSAGGWVAESGATARTSLGLAIGSDVQAYNSNLTAINQALDTTASPSFAGLTVTGTTQIKRLYGALSGTISDDAIYKPAIGGRYSGFVFVTSSASDAAAPISCIIKVRGNSGDEDCQLLLGNTTYVAVDTTELSAGASGGVDGKLNIWADNNEIGFKNRTGGDVSLVITLVNSLS